jgi:small subunit ribosomal protein S3
MSSGAAGIAIRMGGKLGSDISRVEKFSSGYLKYSGNDADTLVKKAYATAIVKLGMIGIQVRILPDRPEELELMQRAERQIPPVEIKVEVEEEAEIKEEENSEKDGDNKEEAAKADE